MLSNKYQKIRVIESTDTQVNIQFVDVGVTLPMNKQMFLEKVKAGFYKVVSTA